MSTKCAGNMHKYASETYAIYDNYVCKISPNMTKYADKKYVHICKKNHMNNKKKCKSKYAQIHIQNMHKYAFYTPIQLCCMLEYAQIKICQNNVN